jgi:uroporphyrinogen decarboxylase
MNARERLLTALNHQEPDRVPLDVGSVQVTGIQAIAYHRLRAALNLPEAPPAYSDEIQQLALPDEDFLQLWGVDTRGLFPLNSHNMIEAVDDGDHWTYHDEWGITHHRLKPDGLYFSIVQETLNDFDVTVQDVENHNWPDMGDPARIAGLRDKAEAYRAAGYAVVLKDPFAGLFEMSQRIVGMENALMFMAMKPAVMSAVFEQLLQLKLDFWEMALPALGDVVDIVTAADDYGTQQSQLISPQMYRDMLKPLYARLFARIKVLAPHVKQFFHSCGNVRPLIPDFIEIGVDILNPVHIRATGMEPAALKADFGKDVCFWGGGVDTQGVLPNGTPNEVREDVRRNVEALAPGGGYVFNTVHNIQADVPPENLIAMWDALQACGKY